MFHVPFDKRDKINDQRFSIKGIPCLYIGSTPYVCYKEILEYKKPNEKLYTSRFQYKKGSKFKILNLSTNFQDIVRLSVDKDNINTHDIVGYDKISKEDYIKKAIYTFPIQCACSYLITENERNFKIEYVIPQIIMNCISNLNIDGISYCSTKFNRKNPYSAYLMTNFAIPAYCNSSELYSEKLSRMFDVTKPLCYEDFMENKPPKTLLFELKKFADSFNTFKSVGEIEGICYMDTDWYCYEKELEDIAIISVH